MYSSYTRTCPSMDSSNITLVTSYSCGEEQCEEGSGSIALDWNEYREHGTEFIKASTHPGSISKNLLKVYNMDPEERESMGKQARQWVIDGFSVETIGKILEDFIDAAPKSDFDFEGKQEGTKLRNFPEAFINNIPDNSEWILTLYKEILNRQEINIHDDGYKYWIQQLTNDVPRKSVEDYFRKVAQEHNEAAFPVKLEDLIDKNDDGKRILFIMPGSDKDVFMSTSLFKSVKHKYPKYNWQKNFGYGTEEHRFALKKFGVTTAHRISFSPVHNILVRTSRETLEG